MNIAKSKLAWVKHSDIDVQKWDACIDACPWGNIYTLSWYLDLICENKWDAFVFGDYEHIMPIPYRKKYGITYVYRPNFSQQLGVFSKSNTLPQSIVNEFIEALTERYALIHYPLNYKNSLADFKGLKIIQRTNLVLDLKDDYEILTQKFSNGLKKSLKSAGLAHLDLQIDINPSDVIDLHKSSWQSKVHIPDSDYANFLAILQYAQNQGQGQCYGLYKNGELLGACAILIYKNRIYYPISAIAKAGRRYAAVAVLINSIIKKHSKSQYIFDFEGSDIETVKTFYLKFNPSIENYTQIKKKFNVIDYLFAGVLTKRSS